MLPKPAVFTYWSAMSLSTDPVWPTSPAGVVGPDDQFVAASRRPSAPYRCPLGRCWSSAHWQRLSWSAVGPPVLVGGTTTGRWQGKLLLDPDWSAKTEELVAHPVASQQQMEVMWKQWAPWQNIGRNHLTNRVKLCIYYINLMYSE